MCYNRLEYLVKWKGYDVSENGWEVYTDVFVPLVTTKFHLDFPNAEDQHGLIRLHCIFEGRPLSGLEAPCRVAVS